MTETVQTLSPSRVEAFVTDVLTLLLVGSHDAARPVRLTSAYARRACDGVLAAADKKDLGEALDDLVSDDRFWCELDPPGERQPLREINARFQLAELDTPSLTRALGVTAAERCLTGHTALKVIIARFLSLVESLRTVVDLEAASTARGARPGSTGGARMTSILYDLGAPRVVRRVTARFLTAMAAATVIARAEEREGRVDPWLAVALADAFAAPLERIRAHTEAERIPEGFDRLMRETDAARTFNVMLEQWCRDAEASGEAIYFPEGGADAGPR